MRYLFIIVAVLALAGTAQAAKPENGPALPAKLSITPKRVEAGERFTLDARGFTPGASLTVLFAISGQEPYGSYAPFYPVEADGTFSIPFVYETCRQTDTGQDVSVDLILTLVDSSGVSDSARLTLC